MIKEIKEIKEIEKQGVKPFVFCLGIFGLLVNRVAVLKQIGKHQNTKNQAKTGCCARFTLLVRY